METEEKSHSTAAKSRLYSFYSNEYAFFIFVGIFIGVLAGLANYVFVETYSLLYGTVVAPYWSSPYVILPLLSGGVVLMLLAYIFPGDVLGYGFTKFLEKINLRGGILKPKETIAKALGACVTLGFGGSAGQEGPIAQLGGAIGSFMGQIFKVSRSKIPVFVACGIAAGIAATFNAPVAGVLFAEEVALLKDFRIGSFLPIVISAAVGTVVTRSLRGNDPIFVVPPYQFVSVKELLFYAVFGILLGFFSAGFIKLFFMVKDAFARIKRNSRLKPVLGGFIVGVIGVFFPYILGNGYDQVDKVLQNELPLLIIVGLIFIKPIATTITIGSGWPGGMFAPSIFIGAAMGSVFGTLVESILASPVPLSGAYATVGMGTFLAAVTQAPLTSIFLIFEMTQSYQVVIPIMISSVLGSVTARLLIGGSLESLELNKAGIHLEEEVGGRIIHVLRARDIMRRDVETIPEDMTLRELIEFLPQSRFTTFPVVDDKENLVGIISIQDFRKWIFEESIKNLVVVKEMATLNVVTVNPDDTLYTVLKKWEKKPVEILPVIESKTSKKVIGALSRKDVIAAYNNALTNNKTM